MSAQPIVALDVASASDALALVEALGPTCDFYKVGSELFTAEGAAVIRELRARGARVFLDLKFHDIPNTVSRAVAVAAGLGVSLLTVHAAGGRRMIEAAVEQAGDCRVLAVTVLTSLDATELAEVWARPVPDALDGEVARLAALAADAGAAGVVCSGREVSALHRRFRGRLELLVPGLRLPGATADDQSRIVTPREAADGGASYLVLGRTVTAAPDPAGAYARVVASLR